jgi:hypothetical protein
MLDEHYLSPPSQNTYGQIARDHPYNCTYQFMPHKSMLVVTWKQEVKNPGMDPPEPGPEAFWNM